MTAAELKASILDQAIRGKLVPQDPSDEPAAELLKRIKAEKAKLIAAKKIKKEKPLAPITDDEKPFDLPEGWEWCRLRDIVYNHGQKTPIKEFSYIDIGSIDNKHQKLNDQETFLSPEKASSRARKIVCQGDIIYSCVRPYLHNIAIIDRQFEKEPIASTGFAVLATCDGVFNKYLFYYLVSPTFDEYANDGDNAKGIGYPAISDEKLYKGLVPLPPLAEQKRIVEKIEELMPLVERYGKAEERRKALNAALPADLEKSILQEAIQGKLVPKTSEWKTVRLGEVCEVFSDGDWIESKDQSNSGFRLVQTGNIGKMSFCSKESRAKYVSKETFKKLNCTEIFPGDILVSRLPDPVGRACIVPDIQERMITAVDCTIVRFKSLVIPEYFIVYSGSSTYYNQVNRALSGTTRKRISRGNLAKIEIPLPPLAEQKAIVAKVEELLAQVRGLRTR